MDKIISGEIVYFFTASPALGIVLSPTPHVDSREDLLTQDAQSTAKIGFNPQRHVYHYNISPVRGDSPIFGESRRSVLNPIPRLRYHSERSEESRAAHFDGSARFLYLCVLDFLPFWPFHFALRAASEWPHFLSIPSNFAQISSRPADFGQECPPIL